MKKILFTLAMLLMAGSAFADNYLYMDDIVLTKNFVQQSSGRAREINVPVKAHFEQWTNAFDVTFNYGTIECRGVATETVGDSEVPITPDMVLKGMNKQGKIVNITVALNSNADADHFIAANSVGGYYYPEGSDPDEDDPIQYGAVKWAPGDYECMFMLVLRIPQNFEEGDITVSSKFASGGDTRPGVETIPAEYANTPTVKVAHVSVIDNTPTISDDGEKVTAVFDGATTNVELYLKNGEEWVKVDNPYTLPEATDVEQVLVFKAITVPAEGAVGQLPAESEEHTVTIKAATPELQPAPAATISNEGNVVTAAVADHTVELYIVTTNDEGEEVLTEVPNPYTVEQTFSEQKITFKALTKANEGESEDTWSEPKEITIPAKPDNQCPQPEFAYYQTPDNELWARVMYYGEAPYTEHVELYIVTTNDEGEEVLTPVDNPYKGLPTENNTFEDIVVKFKAIVKADGVNYNVDNYDYYTVTIPGKEDKQAPAPTFRVEGDKLYAEQGGLTVELYKKNDDGTWTKVDNPYEGLPTENTSYTEPIKIDFKAITLADGVTYNVNSDEATYTYTIDPLNKKTAEKPTIVRDDANMTETTCPIVITADPNTDGTLQYTAPATGTGGAKAAQTQTLYYERKDTEYTVHVEAWTTAGETYLASEVAKADIVIPAKPAPEVIELPDPTISETHDAANQTTIITITVPENTPEGTVLNYTLTDEDGNVIPASDYTVTATDGKIVITIPNGAETAFVTVTATTTMPNAPEGVVVENGEATKTVEVPQYQQTAAPTIDVSFAGEEGHYYANVTFKNGEADPNADIEYCLGDPTVEANWMTYTGAPVVITEDGPHTVYARATATGKATSEVAKRDFELNQTATSVNELVNGKTVAGVRYFNMAGQEMQEANGITIVVTTYTDGTTSAVKVIK